MADGAFARPLQPGVRRWRAARRSTTRVVSPQQLFTLGGFLDLSGLPADALAGTQYGLARAIAYRRMSRGGTGFLEFPAYLGVSFEAGNAWADARRRRLGRPRGGRQPVPRRGEPARAGLPRGRLRRGRRSGRSTCCSAGRSDAAAPRGRMAACPATRPPWPPATTTTCASRCPGSAPSASAFACAAAIRSATCRRRLDEGALVRLARGARRDAARDERPLPLLPARRRARRSISRRSTPERRRGRPRPRGPPSRAVGASRSDRPACPCAPSAAASGERRASMARWRAVSCSGQ